MTINRERDSQSRDDDEFSANQSPRGMEAPIADSTDTPNSVMMSPLSASEYRLYCKKSEQAEEACIQADYDVCRDKDKHWQIPQHVESSS